MTDTISQNGQPAGETLEGLKRRVTDALGREYTPQALAELVKSGIPLHRLQEFGITAVTHPDHIDGTGISSYWVLDAQGGKRRYPGLLFEWRDLDRTVPQFRPDQAVEDSDGKPHKYVLPKDCGVFLSHWRTAAEGCPTLFVEGTKQGISAACWAPAGWGVVAVPGCHNWLGTDLTWAEGRRVVVIFDADLTTNRDVHDAATKLKEALEAEGAEEVAFASLAGARAKEGLDDVLGRRPEDKRTEYLRRIADKAAKKLGRPPARKSENPYMGDKGLLTEKATLAVLDGQPAALAAGSHIALYRHGVFVVEDSHEPLLGKVTKLLGDDHRPAWRAAIEEFMIGELSRRGSRLPERLDRPLLNCANGMLDLVTGELLPHDPAFLSAQQITVAWDPDAQCPTYEAWLKAVIPDQTEELDEVCSTMLDPSRTPLRVLFAFGPTRSGKSTILRILQAVAGAQNYSAVTLHQMSDDKYMAAPIYQKMLNVGADLSAKHVQDLSLFKMMTGEDPIAANRKYGRPFTFHNQALFAFSANELPTVSEGSDAYTARIAPFLFPYSFKGREDPTIEAKILREELPGVLVRWVRAWQAFHARGRYLPTKADVAQEFETRSDRVARWVATRCDVFPDVVDTLVGPEHGDSVQSLYVAFKAWVQDDGSSAAMSRPKFAERLRAISGVGSVRLRHRNKNLGVNVVTHDRDDVEIGHVRAKQDSGVGRCDLSVGQSVASDQPSVGSVGNNKPLNRSGIEGEGGDGVSQTHGAYTQQPTLLTPTHTPQDDLAEAMEWLLSPSTPMTESDDERVRGADEDTDRVSPDAGLHGAGEIPERGAGAGGAPGAGGSARADAVSLTGLPAGCAGELNTPVPHPRTHPLEDVSADPDNPFGNPTDQTPPWEL